MKYTFFIMKIIFFLFYFYSVTIAQDINEFEYPVIYNPITKKYSLPFEDNDKKINKISPNYIIPLSWLLCCGKLTLPEKGIVSIILSKT